METSDIEIVARRHQAEVFRYLRYLGADHHEAEDLVQETFLAAIRIQKAPDQEDHAGMAAWLRAIARNKFLHHWRKTQRLRAKEEVVNPATLEQCEAVWSDTFLRGGDGFDYLRALQECVHDVPRKQREVLGWFYTERKSRQEIAALLEITDDGVKMMLRRVRAGLADCIGRRLATWRTS